VNSPSGAPGRLLIIGLDGATFDLIEPWARAGHLPNFARWMARGSYGPLRSTMPPHSPQAWATFSTGLLPGRHGILDFSPLRIDRPPAPYNAHSVGGVPFWKRLGDQGSRIVVVNALFTYPPEPVNGLLISGKLTPAATTFTHPPELGREIEDRFGEYIPELSPRHLPPASRVTPPIYLERLQAMLARRADVADYVLGRHDWDTAVIVFTALDTIQHFFWHYFDDAHPLHDPDSPSELREAVMQSYRLADQAVGRLAAHLGERDHLLIVSDHGFGPLDQAVNLTRWLVDQGLLAPKAPPRQQGLAAFVAQLKMKAALVTPRILWRAARRLAGTPLQRISPLPYQRMAVDWSRTSAYALGRTGSIFINLRGREPLGIVEPGEEYETLRQAIRTALKAWRNPAIGRPVVAEAHFPEELYGQASGDGIPDLIIQWQDYAYPCPAPGDPDKSILYRIPSVYPKMWLTGYHRLDGILLASGPAFRPGTAVDGAHIADIAPTALYLRRAGIPDHLDGRVLLDLFAPDYLETHPPRYVSGEEAAPPDEQAEATYSADEATEIEERLRGLGYF